MTQDFLYQISQYNVAREVLLLVKADYLAYIKDRTIPLEERWNIYLQMPDFMKESDGWVEYIPIFEEHGLNWYDDFYLDRYVTINLVDIVERLEEALTEEYPLCFEEKVRQIPNIVEEVKEWVLEKNILSFINDW